MRLKPVVGSLVINLIIELAIGKNRVIQCYFDDSGKENARQDPFVCIAGYMADTNTWMLFAQQWRDLLIKHRISHVHMRDLIHLQGEYKRLGWNHQKRDEVLCDFIKTIKEHQLIGFGIGIDANYWRLSRAKSHFESIQNFCFLRIMRRVVERVRDDGLADVVSVTFDNDPEFAGVRRARFSELQRHNHDTHKYLARLIFADPKIRVEIQAADLLAWETRKELVQKYGGHASTPRFVELFTAITGHELDYTSELWDSEALEKVLSN